MTRRPVLCPLHNCALIDYFTFSPDGKGLAFAFETGGSSSVIALFDLASGQITELESTATSNASDFRRSTRNQRVNEFPRWSPDGTDAAWQPEP